jgi:class 3 adenylate cyclase/tetratricopeptide (TPR) repeat protein
MACSSPLAKVEPEGSRRIVTILFCDLKGSTDLGEALDSESLRDVMSSYFDRMRSIIETHGGTVEKYIGDAVMAVFGLPRAHEDDGMRAVRTAWEMQSALSALNDELELRWGVRLAHRIGVNTGEVVAGDAVSRQRMVTGDAVNTAARLEQAAAAGQTLIGESTYGLVRHLVEVEPAGELALKGKAESVAAFRLVGIPALPGSSPQMTPIIGREAELRSLRDAIERANGGPPRLVCVVGDAGIGKSRLLREFEASLPPDTLVLRGRCPSYGEGLTFVPLSEILQSAAGKLAGDLGAGADIPQMIGALATGHPRADEIADWLTAALGASAATFSLEETFLGVHLVLEHLAAARPVVLQVEDVHWAEQAFLDLLDYLTRLPSEGRALITCSARPQLLEDRPDWVAGRQLLHLEPLPKGAVDDLVSALAGAALPTELRSRVGAAAQGNPLFVEQLIASIRERGEPDEVWSDRGERELDIPPTISALLAARLDRLGSVERTVVERAAVAGREFSQAALEELCAGSLTQGLDHSLAALTRDAFIEPDTRARPAPGAWFRFRHELIRDAAYAGMLKKQRAELHERLADWLVRAPDDNPEGEELVGYHLEQAFHCRVDLAPADAQTEALGLRAGRLLGSAGRRALERGDIGAAAGLLVRTLKVWPQTDDGRVSAMVDAGAALRESGQLEQARAELDQAIAVARSQGDVLGECRAAVERIEVDTKTGALGWPERADEEAKRLIPLLERANADLELAKVWRMLSWVANQRGSLAGWDEASWRSIEHARRAGARREEIEVLAGLALRPTYGEMPCEEGIARCQWLLDEVSGNPRAEAFVLAHVATLLMFMGRLDDARTTLDDAIERYERVGAFAHTAPARCLSAELELWAGNAQAAESILDDIARRTDDRALRSSGTLDLLRARVRLHQGREGETLALTTGGGSGAGQNHEIQRLSVRATALARLGRAAEAETCAEQARRLVANDDDVTLHAEVWMAVGEVRRAAGRPDDAVKAFAESIRISEAKGARALADQARAALATIA